MGFDVGSCLRVVRFTLDHPSIESDQDARLGGSRGRWVTVGYAWFCLLATVSFGAPSGRIQRPRGFPNSRERPRVSRSCVRSGAGRPRRGRAVGPQRSGPPGPAGHAERRRPAPTSSRLVDIADSSSPGAFGTGTGHGGQSNSCSHSNSVGLIQIAGSGNSGPKNSGGVGALLPPSPGTDPTPRTRQS